METSKAADIIEEVETTKAARVVEEVETSKAADIIEEVETTKAARVVEEVETSKAADIIEEVETTKAARVVEQVETSKAADIIEEVETTKAARVVEQVETSKAADIIEEVETTKAARVVEQVETSKAADIIEEVETTKAARVVEQVETSKAADIIEEVETTKAARVVEQVETSKAADIIEKVETTKAARVVEQVETLKAADIIEEVETSKASDVLAEAQPVSAGKILKEVTTTKVTRIVQAMDEDKLVDRLPEMNVERLDDIDDQVLFDELPNVPAEQLAAEVAPEVDPTLGRPSVVERTDTRSVYLVGETPEQDWITTVESPAPIDKVLTKFNKRLTDVQVTIQDLANMPARSPKFAAEFKVYSLFSIELTNATADDVVAARVTLFVEKSWLEANDVHTWSIQFQRLDEKANRWVAFQPKRVAEDEERIFYSVVVPGFSVIAVTGSDRVPAPLFAVTDLVIGPDQPTEDRNIQISATVTNLAAESGVFPSTLWINDTAGDS